jgi:prolyl-tRNA synthetase
LKNVIVKLRRPDGSSDVLAIGVPGDREVDAKRLEAQVAPAEVEAFEDADFAQHPALVRGYIGPAALGTQSASGIRYLVDPRVVAGTAWVTGHNVAGQHVRDLVVGRDFTPDGTIEAAEVRAGDPCPNCSTSLEMARGIEIGHIFQLGRKYAEALGLKVQDESGKQVTVTMGSYGMGVSRVVACLAETNHDEYGLVWPRAVAPADVHVVIAGKDGRSADGALQPSVQREAAEALAAVFEAAGLRVLFDDREGVSPGVRFKDAELIGVPVIVVAGRGIEGVGAGTVELKNRRSGARDDVPVADALDRVQSLLTTLP